MVLKSDQENANLDVVNNIALRRSARSKVEPIGEEKGGGPPGAIPQQGGSTPPGRNIPEPSPVGSSGSNGFIERGIQAGEGQGRTIKLAVESHTGHEVPSDHDVIPRMIEVSGRRGRRDKLRALEGQGGVDART